MNAISRRPMSMTSIKKLLFSPSPYPDELLFSILSRYHQRSCNFDKSSSNTDLFDTEHPSLNLLLPFSLNKLHSKLPDGSLMTVKRLISDHTLFRLFSAFTTKLHQNWISAFMSGSTVNAYPCFMFHRHRLRSYSMAPRNSSRRFLKLCPKCIISDVSAYGETYWHRSHQVYGIDVCHEHAEWLVESDIEVNRTARPTRRRLSVLSSGMRWRRISREGRFWHRSAAEARHLPFLSIFVHFLPSGYKDRGNSTRLNHTAVQLERSYPRCTTVCQTSIRNWAPPVTLRTVKDPLMFFSMMVFDKNSPMPAPLAGPLVVK